MSGIVFMKSRQLSVLKDFYQTQIDCSLWLDQKDCLLFRHGNFLFGFCQRDSVDTSIMLTFFYDTKEEVDRMYSKLEPSSTTSPETNMKYRIYQFFAKDPEGRILEFQHFSDPVAEFRSGEDLLLSRRSVRDFTGEQVPDALLQDILNISRYAPTSMNKQSYYFKFIRDRQTLEWLSTVRGSSTGPIGRASTAVAICSDPTVSLRSDQDACIAAYHFMLAAWFHGLGTCWIGGMNRDDVKSRLEIPKEHYLATVTPLGYPRQRLIPVPDRKGTDEFVRT